MARISASSTLPLGALLAVACLALTSQAASLYKRKCVVDQIKVQEDFDLNQFTGFWYDIQRLAVKHQSFNLSSAVGLYTAQADGSLQITYGGQTGFSCVEPMSASGFPLYSNAKWHVMFDDYRNGFLRGPLWVIETDYSRYALLYGCFKMKVDGTCHDQHQLVYVLGRTKTLDSRIHRRLDYIIQNYLCVDPTSLDNIMHLRECPPSPAYNWDEWRMLADEAAVDAGENAVVDDAAGEAAVQAEAAGNDADSETPDVKECKMADLKPAEGFTTEKWMGKWYVVASNLGISVNSAAMLTRKMDDGNVECFLTKTRSDGHCDITSYRVMTSTDTAGVFTVPVKEDIAEVTVAYLSDSGISIMYRCGEEQPDGACAKPSVTVFSRSKDVSDESTAEIKQALANLCLDYDEFTLVPQEVECEIDTGDGEHSCKVEDVKAADNLDWTKLAGTWYTTGTLNGNSPPSLTWFNIQKDESTIESWLTYSSDNICHEPKSIVASVEGSHGILKTERDGKSRIGKIVYTDNNKVMFYYQCGRVLEDGTCDPDHSHLDISSTTREIQGQNLFIWYKVLLQNLCISVDQMKSVSHEVQCEADPSLPSPQVSRLENDEADLSARLSSENCHFVNLKAQEEFDLEKFMGTWYHMYRLKSSNKEFSAEVNQVEKTPDGTIKTYGSYFHDGRCSDTKVTLYTQAKTAGEWSFDTYGGVKILYADDMYSVIYICDHVEKENNCKPENIKIEVLARHTDIKPPQEVINIIVAILEAACFHMDDFEKLDHSVECELRQVGCSIHELEAQEDFNIERFTGTWNAMVGLKRTQTFDSAGIRITKSDKGYKITRTRAKDGECVFTDEDWHIDSGSLVYSEQNALMRVLYTDYDNAALVYVCRGLNDDGESCSPDKEVVFGFSRTFDLGDKQVRAMVDIMHGTCFSQDDFQWFPRTLNCEFEKIICPIADLPKAETFNPSKFVGRWYAMFVKAGEWPWENGVAEYEFSENGMLKVHVTGSSHGKCLATQSVVSAPGDHPYEWNIRVGAVSAYVRILDASDVGDDHAVVYQCDNLRDDGSCDPINEHVGIITRRREDMSEDTRKHLRQIAREACIEPGDLVETIHNTNCPIITYSHFECNYNELPSQADFDANKFSGTWHVVARLNGTSVPESAHIRFEFNAEEVSMHTTGFSVRYGCRPTLTRVAHVNSDNPAEFVAPTSSIRSKVVWTDYENALMFLCVGVQDDGHCPEGSSVGMLLSRGHEVLSEDVVAHINEASDQPCMQRENYQWVNFDEHCELHLEPEERCKAENIHPADNFNFESLAGEWHLLRHLRRDMNVGSSEIHFDAVSADVYRMAYAISFGEECFQFFRYAKKTAESGRMEVQNGREVVEVDILYQSDDHIIYLFCPLADGFCNPERIDINMYGRSRELPSQEMIDIYNGVLQSLCYVPGDAVEPIDALTAHCEMPADPVAIKCALNELPVKENLNFELVTGTWYAVARLKGSLVRANSMIRIEHVGEAKYELLYTALSPNGGGCRTPSHATMAVSQGSAATFDIDYGDDAHGSLRVLYADNVYTLVYDCWHVLDDGSCPPGSETIMVLSRSKYLPDDALPRMTAAGAKAGCYDRHDFEPVYLPAECAISHAHDYKCKVRNIPSQDNFDVDKFLGTWYSRYKLYTEWNTVVYNYERDVNGQFVVYYSGEVDGECTKPCKHELQGMRGGHGRYTSHKHSQFAETKIVYTDYHYALIYNCDKIQYDGHCAPGHLYVDVASRDLDPIPDAVEERIKEALHEACLEIGDFTASPHLVNCDPRKSLPCQISDMPTQSDFHMIRFTGEWNIVARARHTTTDISAVDSTTLFVKANSAREFAAYFSFFEDGECREREVLLHPGYRGQAADSHVHIHGDDHDIDGFFRVLYTDYEYALAYFCMHVPRGGDILAGDKCYPGFSRLVVLSRTTSVPNSKIRAILEEVNMDCLTDDQFVWVDHEVDCVHAEAQEDCVVDHFHEADDFDVDGFVGTWYTRFALRSHPPINSMQVEVEKLDDGNIKMYGTGARDGHCSGQSLNFVAQKSDRPAVFYPRGNGEVSADHLSSAVVKVLFADDHYAVVYECSDITADGICEPHHVHVLILSRSKSTQMSRFTVKQLIKVATSACLEVGQFVPVPQTEDCHVEKGHGITCSVDDMPEVPNFNFMRSTGMTYTVMRLRGGSWPDGAAGYISPNGDGTYEAYLRWARFGDCMPTGHGHVEVADDKPEWYLVVNGVRVVSARSLWMDGEYNLVRECHRLSDDGSGACVPGYETLVVFAHAPHVPPSDVIDKMVEAAGSCFHSEDLETVPHDLICRPEVPVPSSCFTNNMPVVTGFDSSKFEGTWYFTARLRGTSNMESGKVQITKLDDETFKGEFAFRIDGECSSLDTMYFLDANKPGVLLTHVGRFLTTIRILYVDEDYQNLVFYECEQEDSDGLCAEGARFVGWYSRTTEQPSLEQRRVIGQVLHKVCVQPGDMVLIHHQGDECEIAIDKAEVGCAIDELPVNDNVVHSKDTGLWYALAKLRGTNFLNGHQEYGFFDREHDRYGYYFSGARVRGGCTRTGHQIVPRQTIGKRTGTVSLDFGDHKGVWKAIYDDYRYALYYECIELRDDNTCRPGFETVAVYSRKNERLPEEMIEKIFAGVPEKCMTRADFEWILNEDSVCPLDVPHGECRVREIPAIENLRADVIEGQWYSRFMFAYAHDAWDSYGVRFERKPSGGMRAYYTPTRGGSCLRSMERDIAMATDGRGVWYRETGGDTVVEKLLYADAKYAVLYSCLKVLENDKCDPNNEFAGVLARDLDTIPVSVVEKLKDVLYHACIQPGEVVESDHTVPCEEKACALDDVKTWEDYDVSVMYATWQLLGRTSQLHADRGPTTMRYTKGNHGTLRMNMARKTQDGCKDIETIFKPVEGDPATLTFDLDGVEGIMKVVHICEHFLLTYECFDAEAVEGYCPEDHEEVQVWARDRDALTEEWKEKLKEMTSQRTCVDMQTSQVVEENTECHLEESCSFDDMVAMDDFEPHNALGMWHLVAEAIPEGAKGATSYHTLSMKFIVTGDHSVDFLINGKREGSEECAPVRGHVSHAGSHGAFVYDYGSGKILTKPLYKDDDIVIEMECRGESSLEEGASCPADKASFYLWSRGHEISDEKLMFAKGEAVLRTHGCYSVEFKATDANTDCPVEETCKLADFVTTDDFTPSRMLGTWSLVAKQGPGDYLTYDMKVEYDSKNHFKYSMNGKVQADGSCHPDEGTLNHVEDTPGLYHYAYQGVKTLAKMLYSGRYVYIDMECKANFEDGSCSQEDATFFIQSREHKPNEGLLEFAKKEIVKRTHGCFDVSGLTLREENDCEFNGMCKFTDMNTAPDFNPRDLLGTWHMVGHATPPGYNVYRTYSAKYLYVHDNMMHYVCSGVTKEGEGACFPDRGTVTYLPDQHGVYKYTYMDQNNYALALYKDDKYYIEMECKEELERGECALDHVAFFVYSRTYDTPLELHDLAQEQIVKATHGCYDVSHFHFTELNSGCELPPTCRMADLATSDAFSPSQLLGTWQLLARSRPDDGPYFRSYTIKFGYITDTHAEYIMSGKRWMGDKCELDRGELMHIRDQDNTYAYTYAGIDTIAKNLYLDDDLMIEMECKSTLVDGACPRDKAAFFAYGREHDGSQALRNRVIHAITERTHSCFDVHVTMSEENHCEVPHTCFLDEFVMTEGYHPRMLLGTWHVVARQLPEEIVKYHSAQVKFTYHHEQEYLMKVAGERIGSPGCSENVLEMSHSTGRPGVYKYFYNGIEIYGAVLYVDSDWYIEMGCMSEFVDGHCPDDRLGFFVYGREHRVSQELKDMFRAKIKARTSDCFDLRKLVFVDKTVCDLEESCRLNELRTVDDFQPSAMLGTWELVVISTPRLPYMYQGFTIKFNFVDDHSLEFKLNGKLSEGGECSSHHGPVLFGVKNPGTYIYEFMGRRAMSKALYSDDNLYAEMICRSALHHGVCPPDQAAFFIYAKKYEKNDELRAKVVEQLVANTHGCYDLTDLAYTEPNSECDLVDTCLLEDFVTVEEFDMHLLLGNWQLSAAHISGAPDFYHSYDIRYGHVTRDSMEYRIAGTRGDSDVCSEDKAQMTYVDKEHDVYNYAYRDHHTTAKTLYADDKVFIEMECSTNFADGHCDEDDVSFYVHTRVHNTSEEVLHKAQAEIRKRTNQCYDVSGLHVAEKTDCKMTNPCYFVDFAHETMEHFDLRHIVGTWELVAMATPDVPDVYRGFTVKYGYHSPMELTFTLNGKMKEGDECHPDHGTVVYHPRHSGLYEYHYEHDNTLAKVLYRQDDYFIEVECFSDLVEGKCPPDQTAFYAYARSPDIDEAHRVEALKAMARETEGCYDVSHFHLAEPNECETAEPEGRASCGVAVSNEADDFDMSTLTGLWFVVAYTDSIDLVWDAGVNYNRITDDGNLEMTYTGFYSYASDRCMPAYNMLHRPIEGHPGRFRSEDPRHADTSVSKILFASEDYFVYYECVGENVDEFGACARESEYLEINSRRRGINSVDKKKLERLIADQTCVDTSTFVHVNQSRLCDLPGVLDTDPEPESCEISSYEVHADLDLEKFAGEWYELERSRFAGNDKFENSVIQITAHDESLEFEFHASKDGVCYTPFKGHTETVRHEAGDMVMRAGEMTSAGNPFEISFKFKVLYTDYDSVAVTYACAFWHDDGTCRRPGEQVNVLSRSPAQLTDDVRQQLYDVMEQHVCVRHYDLVKADMRRPCDHCAERPQCRMYCEHGFKKGDDGCDLCECAEGPEPEMEVLDEVIESEEVTASYDDMTVGEVVDPCAGRPMCLMACPHGFVVDDNGCSECKCKEPEEEDPCAGRPMCLIACPNGHVQDEHGCDTCECVTVASVQDFLSDRREKPYVPSEAHLKIDEESDFVDEVFEMGSIGEEDEESLHQGQEHGEDIGNISDENGAEHFEREPEDFTNVYDDDTVEEDDPCAGQPMCLLACPSGFVQDEHGCDTCECVAGEVEPDPCAGQPMCMLACPSGFVQDEHGCDTCECVTDVEEPNPCAGKPMCLLACPSGFVQDEHGCDTCECVEDDIREDLQSDRNYRPHIDQYFDQSKISREVGLWRRGHVDDVIDLDSRGGEHDDWTDASELRKNDSGYFEKLSEYKHTTTTHEVMCPVPMCAMDPCEHGLATNEQGCEICECRDAAPGSENEDAPADGENEVDANAVYGKSEQGWLSYLESLVG